MQVVAIVLSRPRSRLQMARQTKNLHNANKYSIVLLSLLLNMCQIRSL